MKKIYVNSYFAFLLIALFGIGATWLIVSTANKFEAESDVYAQAQGRETDHGHTIRSKVYSHIPTKPA